MDNNSKSGKSNIYIIVLVLIISVLLIVIGFMMGKMNSDNNSKNSVQDNNNLNNNNNNQDKENNNTDFIDDTLLTDYKCSSNNEYKNLYYSSKLDLNKYNNISNYLREQKDLSATIKSIDPDGTETSKNILNNDLNKIIEEMETLELGYNQGVGGAGYTGLIINYTRNSQKKYIEFGYLSSIKTNDGNIIRLIDKLGNIDGNMCVSYNIPLFDLPTVKNVLKNS